jgi:sugar lactone lactonase YvrE
MDGLDQTRVMMVFRRSILAVPAVLAAAPAGAQALPVEPLARFPAGTFLENLAVRPDGSVLFTNYFARRVEAWSPTGTRTWAGVPLHPVSLALLEDGAVALAGHGAVFTQGPAALRGSGAVLVLDAQGGVRRRLPLPEAIFPNGILMLAPGTLLLADSALGRIWAVPLDGTPPRPWLDDAALAGDPARPSLPGVNGVKRSADGRALLVSNSATRALLRVGLDAAGAPAGGLAPVARFPGIDDFWVLPDGTIWAATHGGAIARLRPGAAEAEAFPVPGLEGNTALAVLPGAAAAYVLGTGGLSEGGRGEAMLARVALPG